jgi:hypothetical protein
VLKKTAIIDCQTFTDDSKLSKFIWNKIQEEKAPPGTLLIAILPENAADLYANIKRVGDIVLGVPTQCIVRTQFSQSESRAYLFPSEMVPKVDKKYQRQSS